MDPDIGVGIGSEGRPGGPRRARPTAMVRVLEIGGMVLVAAGLAVFRLDIAAVGALMIGTSYTLYRRKHGSSAMPDPEGSGRDLDGGGA